MTRIESIFGSMVFSDKVMRERLPEEAYKSLRKTIENGKTLDLSLANTIAAVMKDWAVEKGATHFTHWFQPMTGITAEKHDSFISPQKDGTIMLKFSGKELIKGESDASSFPSGGLRASFEARGYTAWDPTSYAFIKENTLCIPTVFCAYNGEALDKKTPLMRSTALVSAQAKRVLKLFGIETKSVVPTIGSEQEYFLIDKSCFDRREDLVYTGRTLFGARPPKGQELSDHYYGAIKPRVKAFMAELDDELWKLGVYANTEHNEVAPAQHELAPIYTSVNIATDQNQLTMECMKRIAERHGLVCLLHEKPFAGVNGSGKHINWSLQTAEGSNLFNPGKSPSENAVFLLFLCAVIRAVDSYADILRISAATAGNDHRLGGSEAPPAVFSVSVGDDLYEILSAIEENRPCNNKNAGELEIGVDSLPHFPRDTTDRNRTSPFAFTGNKFEFRMVGSSQSTAGPVTMLNTAVGDTLSDFADVLENAPDFNEALNLLIRKTIKEHKKILFNGNNYTDEWIAEAKKRGLVNFTSTPEALPHFTDKKNSALFAKWGIYSESELKSRVEILQENYIKTLSIEALTMMDMAKRDVVPALIRFSGDVSASALSKKTVCADADITIEEDIIKELSLITKRIYESVVRLDRELARANAIGDITKRSIDYRNRVFSEMEALRAFVDKAETIVAKTYWPYPSYGEILYSV